MTTGLGVPMREKISRDTVRERVQAPLSLKARTGVRQLLLLSQALIQLQKYTNCLTSFSAVHTQARLHNVLH